MTYPEDYPDPEDLERQFHKSVGPFIYTPLVLPTEPVPAVLWSEVAWPDWEADSQPTNTPMKEEE